MISQLVNLILSFYLVICECCIRCFNPQDFHLIFHLIMEERVDCFTFIFIRKILNHRKYKYYEKCYHDQTNLANCEDSWNQKYYGYNVKKPSVTSYHWSISTTSTYHATQVIALTLKVWMQENKDKNKIKYVHISPNNNDDCIIRDA